jgi:hypothetical protein
MFWCVQTKLRTEVVLRLCSRKLYRTSGNDRNEHSTKLFVQVRKTLNGTRTVIDNQKQLPSPFTSRTSKQGKNLLEPMYLTAPCFRASVKLVVAIMFYAYETQIFENEVVERRVAAAPYISELQCKEVIIAAEIVNARITLYRRVNFTPSYQHPHRDGALLSEKPTVHTIVSTSPRALIFQLPRGRCPVYIVVAAMFLTCPVSQHPLHIANGTIYADVVFFTQSYPPVHLCSLFSTRA